jgi:hypothetical protein
MPKGMQAIYSQIGTGGATAFNNIPQTFTDLKIVFSQRNSSSNVAESLAVRFDSSDFVYSHTVLYGSGTGTASARRNLDNFISFTTGMFINGNTSTTNTYASTEIYIPNYTSSMFKQVLIDSVTENNAAEAYSSASAALYRNNSPIKTIYVQGYSASMMDKTTVTIYGISR